MIKIRFCGAAGTVTGSNYLVTVNDISFVVDAGMFQGPDVEHLNLEKYDYDPSTVSFALLTHAHIDHSGMLPKLVKHGFEGEIYSTRHTAQISAELLLDSAKIQERSYQNGETYGKYTNVKALVYNTSDALKTIEAFKLVDFNEEFVPFEGIKVKYIVAGHILGAASIEIEINDKVENETKKIIFSGDIGRLNSHLIETFDGTYSAKADFVIMESLYGGIIHQDRDESAKKLAELIKETTDRKGNAFIPCFAVQRTQEVLNDIKNFKDSQFLDNDLGVWLDSPLAQRVTKTYNDALQSTEKDLFNFKNLFYVKKYKQSMQLANKFGQVIIAGSGMADGGRIVDHLARGLENSKNSVIFVGFQAEGTLGRQLVEGAKSVTIGTRNIKVNAQIHSIEGFSAHGDTNDYTAWLKRFVNDNLKQIYLVHAEPDRALALKAHFDKLGITQTHLPKMHEEVTL